MSHDAFCSLSERLVGEGHGGQRTDDGHHRDVGDAGRVGEGLQVAGGSQGLLGTVGGDDDVHQWSPNLSGVVAEPEGAGGSGLAAEELLRDVEHPAHGEQRCTRAATSGRRR